MGISSIIPIIQSIQRMDVVVVSLLSLVLLIGGSNGANMVVAMAIPSPMDYWQKLFPETPMPPAILDLTTEELKEVSVAYGKQRKGEATEQFLVGRSSNSQHEKSLYSTKEELKEVTVSYGPEDEEKQSKVFHTEYRSNNEYEKYLNKSEEGLKEVSVSYGRSVSEEDPRKAFHMGRYMLDKEREKSLRTNKVGLKEVSISYGSDKKEDPKRAFPMEGYKLDKESEKPLQTDKEELREVSVSYGLEEKVSNSFPTRYDRKKYIRANEERLKEVSVSYRSDDEMEPGKAFPTRGYMLDKQREKSSHIGKEELREVSVSYSPEVKLSDLFPTEYDHKKFVHADEAGLKEVSVSYGSGGKEELVKGFSTRGYVLDKERIKSLPIGREELREVSVSYGPEVKLSNLFPTGYEHKKYIHTNQAGLKEVSMSYGSDDEEDPRKSFPAGRHTLDKEHDKSLYIDKGMDHHRHVHAQRNKMQLADVFFFHDALRPGSVITPTIPPTTSLPALLPRHVADSIPFSVDRFADVVAMFAPASLAMAREIRWALDTCQHPRAPLPGEKAGCATSLESLADLAASLLGTRDVRAFSAAGLPTDAAGTPAKRGRYNVTSVRELSAGGSPSSDAVVACHDLTYPYAVFYCHTTKPTAAYAVTLVATGDGDDDDEGDKGGASPATMEALAVCHLDTSRWSPENPFFVAHGVKPGEVSVCHFLTKLSIVWVPRNEQGGPRAA